MAEPEIGLKAVMDMADFVNGLKEYLDGVDEAKGKTTSASNQMTAGLAAIGGAAVTAAMAAAAAGIAAIGAAAAASISTMLDWAGTVDSIGDVLGTNAEESSALAVAIQHVGGNVEALTGQMAFLTRGLVDAKGEIGPTGQVLQELGISFQDANGNLLPTTDILTAVADKLSKMPDGLEKTTLMTRLFGKSGKDLTDTLNALTTEGFAEADAMAKELGLSLGDDAVGGAIELQKQFAFLKMAGQGLLVSLGKELAPALSDLTGEFMKMIRDALPKIREMLPQIAAVVGKLASAVLKALPVIVGWFGKFFGFLINNKFLIIGALAGITVAIAVWAYTTITAAIPAIVAFVTAMWPAIAVILLVSAVVAALAWAWENNFLGMRDTLTQFWEQTVRPALQALWEWLSVNVPAAIETLRGFWEGVLLPAIQAVWGWIQSNLFPLFQLLWNWLSINVPKAIQTLSAVWTTRLLPAIKAVWAWMNSTLFPFLKALASFLQAAFAAAVRVAGQIWTSTFLPPIQAAIGWVQSNVIPVLQNVANFLTSVFGPAFDAAAGFIKGAFTAAIEWITTKLQELTDWLNKIIDALNGIGKPDEETPEGETSSPTLGPRGVSPTAAGLTGPSRGPTPSAANMNVTNTWNFGNNNISSPMAAAALEAAIVRTIRRELRTV